MKKTYFLLSTLTVGALAAVFFSHINDKIKESRKQLNLLRSEVKTIKFLLEKKTKSSLPKPLTLTKNKKIKASANVKALSKLKLPENPTKQEVADYYNKIYSISKKQNYFSSNDPQIEMIVKAGKKYLPLCFEKAQNNFGASFYFKTAIQQLLTNADKKLVLKHLYQCPFLIKTVRKYGWQKEAAKIIFDKIKSTQDLPSEWIDAAIDIASPTDFEKLANHMVNASQPYQVYKRIRNLPEIKLDKAAGKLWKQRIYRRPWQQREVALVAANFGYIEALENVIDDLNNKNQYYAKMSYKELYDLTGQSGKYSTIKKWFEDNKNKLYFDKNNQKYMIKGK